MKKTMSGLVAAALTRDSATGRARRNMPEPIPCFLLGRLAVDRRHQGVGLGAALLRDAIRRSLAAAEVLGARLLLVHAIDDQARSFYEHFDFEPSPSDPMHLLLVLDDATSAVDPSVEQVDLTRHGYGVLEVTRERARMRWYFVDDVQRRDSPVRPGFAWHTRYGSPGLRRG